MRKDCSHMHNCLYHTLWNNQFSLTELHKGKMGQLNYVQTEITSAAFSINGMQINVYEECIKGISINREQIMLYNTTCDIKEQMRGRTFL